MLTQVGCGENQRRASWGSCKSGPYQGSSNQGNRVGNVFKRIEWKW